MNYSSCPTWGSQGTLCKGILAEGPSWHCLGRTDSTSHRDSASTAAPAAYSTCAKGKTSPIPIFLKMRLPRLPISTTFQCRSLTQPPESHPGKRCCQRECKPDEKKLQSFSRDIVIRTTNSRGRKTHLTELMRLQQAPCVLCQDTWNRATFLIPASKRQTTT